MTSGAIISDGAAATGAPSGFSDEAFVESAGASLEGFSDTGLTAGLSQAPFHPTTAVGWLQSEPSILVTWRTGHTLAIGFGSQHSIG